MVDVIILSFTKTQRELEMVKECLRTLRSSDTDVQFNTCIVETSSYESLTALGGEQPFGVDCRILFPNQQFNYNTFLQIGWEAVKDSTSEHLLIANNDVQFEPGFAHELLKALLLYESVSPWCPDFHERFFDGQQAYYVGHRTALELCGWAIMCRKSLLRRIGFSRLFPSEFAFWFQDDYYAMQLRRLGVAHSLVRDAVSNTCSSKAIN